MKLIPAIGILFSAPLWAIEGSWDYSADPFAKNRTAYYADQNNVHIETEIFDYNQDFTSKKVALGYFRSDFMVDLQDGSTLEIETLGDRSNEENPDIDNITSYVRHFSPIASLDSFTLNFLTQLTLPMNRSSFEEEESPKPVMGLSLDFYESERFNVSMSFAISNSSDLELQEWKKAYISSFYMSWSLTEKLSTSLDLYFEREQGVEAYGYKWVIASLNYEINDELNLNLGTRTVGDEEAATNTMLGATLIY